MATPQNAMAHRGSLSITFANIFSASSYSKECNKAIARSKSSFVFSEHDVVKETVPNSLSGEPHTTTLPRLRFIELIASPGGAFVLSLQESVRSKVNKTT